MKFLAGLAILPLLYLMAPVDECATNNGGCTQTCTDTLASYYCSCEEGYQFDPTGIAGGCRPTCYDSIGDYECFCAEGLTFHETAARQGTCQ